MRYYPYASYSIMMIVIITMIATPRMNMRSPTDDPNSGVSQVQRAALGREGFYHGAIDGSVGPATGNALRRYQRDRGLSVTGRIDRSVVEALRLR